MHPGTAEKLTDIRLLRAEINRLSLLLDDMRDLVREVAAIPGEDTRKALAGDGGDFTDEVSHVVE